MNTPADKPEKKTYTITICVIVFLVIYFGSYYAIVRPTPFSLLYPSLGPSTSIVPDYRSRPIELGLPFSNHVELSQVLKIIFVPAYHLDREIRPHVWK